MLSFGAHPGYDTRGAGASSYCEYYPARGCFVLKSSSVVPRSQQRLPSRSAIDIRRTAQASRFAVNDIGFQILAVAVEAGMTVLIAIATGIAYHLVRYDVAGPVSSYAGVGCLAAMFYILPFLFRDEYRVHTYVESHRNLGRLFAVWNYTFLYIGVIGFLTKAADDTSRGWIALFYLGGLIVPLGVSALVAAVLRKLARSGRVRLRRLMLIGSEPELSDLARQIDGERSLIEIVAMETLPLRPTDLKIHEAHALREVLASASARARALRVDDVVVGTELRDTAIRDVVACFAELPLSIHLAASRLLGSYANAGLSNLSGVKVISLAAPPLAPWQRLAKRSFDVVLSTAALLVLSPLLLAIASAIKLTSPGPVFFRQRRSGYNLETFRIWKFRTMTTMDDGDTIVQAERNDSRLTPIGRYLRRLNLDELPQLFNVVRGEMSLVGPRPHAVTHDVAFATQVTAYARRLNVRPGITGWAQVNGFRGATRTDAALKERIRHDLYYIDNWSILFDLYIIMLTLLSPKSYRNAV